MGMSWSTKSSQVNGYSSTPNDSGVRSPFSSNSFTTWMYTSLAAPTGFGRRSQPLGTPEPMQASAGHSGVRPWTARTSVTTRTISTAIQLRARWIHARPPLSRKMATRRLLDPSVTR